MNFFFFAGANELRLKAIVTSGGPQKLCQLWHTDVYEVRQNIMRTFRHLLGKYLAHPIQKPIPNLNLNPNFHNFLFNF